MSGTTVGEFLAYWQHEGEAYVRHGDYDWMAGLVPGRRVLEVGCGVGYATQALLKRGLQVLAVDSLAECLAATRQRVGDANDLDLLQAELPALSAEARQAIERFAPQTVVCWLMGAPATTTGAQAGDGGGAVAAYREKIHRAVAELAAGLPSVQALHLVDRTAIPWQAKDIGRETLLRYHQGKTLLDLPFAADRLHALYRKLGESVVDIAHARRLNPSLKSVVPVLASLLAKRKA